jgi:hypothetical protein
MGQGFCGTATLSGKLSKILYTHIKYNLPAIVKEIIQRKHEVRERLEDLGPAMPENPNDKLQMAWGMVMEFCAAFHNAISGKAITQKDRRERGKKIQGGAQIKIMYYNLYKDIARADYKITENYDDEMINQAILIHEGDRMPGFPSADVFVSLVGPEIEKLKQPALDLLYEVYNYLEDLASTIQAHCFVRFPQFGQEILEKILEILQEKREKTRYLVESIIDSEQSYMFTNDPEYLVNRTDIVTVIIPIN